MMVQPSSDGVTPPGMSRNFMAELGERLIENGYPILPIIPGSKSPGRWSEGRMWQGYKDWTKHCDRPTKPFELDIWRRWAGCGIGAACGSTLRAVDIDLLQEDIALAIEAAAREELGDTPCLRIGQAPKRLLVYRAATSFPSIKRHPIEILGHGAQFVAYAVHPDTGRPYFWPHEGLDEVHVSRLPTVTEEQCRRFLDIAFDLVPPELRRTTLGPDRSADYYYAGGELRGTVPAVAAAMAHIPNNDLAYDDWVRIGLALKGAVGEAGGTLFCHWSSHSTKDQPNYTLKTWRGLKPNSIGAGTLYYYAGQNGWVPDHDLVLNGALEDARNSGAGQQLIASLSELPPHDPETGEINEPAQPVPYTGTDIDAIVAAAPGALGRMTRWMIETAVSPQPLLSLGASLCAYGVAMGRQYRLERPDTRSNVYVIALADSGAGKDHPRRCVRRAMIEAGLGPYLGGETLASGAAVMSSISQHPCRLFQVDEFGHFIQAVLDPKSHAHHRREIMTNLTTLWSSASEVVLGTEYANQKDRPRADIHEPCVCVYGSTVPATFWRALQSGNVSDGSIARFLVLQTLQNYPDDQTPQPVDHLLPSIVGDLKAVAAGADGHSGGNLGMISRNSSTPFTVPVGPEIEPLDAALRAEHLARKRQHENTVYSSIVARFREHVRRVMLIAAVADNPAQPVVRAPHFEWATSFVRWTQAALMEQSERFIADTQHEASLKKLLDIIRRHGGWMDGNELSRRTQFLNRRDRTDQITQLEESGHVEFSRESTASKPRILVRAVKNS